MAETYTLNNRTYVNPEVSRDEQMAFIDTLRDTQAKNTQKIIDDTHNLGTDVTPVNGGLTGAEDLWKARYQTPQTNAVVADLKAAAQASALTTAMNNYKAQLQKQYDDAYKKYQKRASTTNNTPSTNYDGDVDYVSSNKGGDVEVGSAVRGGVTSGLSAGQHVIKDNASGDEYTVVIDEYGHINSMYKNRGFLADAFSFVSGNSGNNKVVGSKANELYKSKDWTVVK